MLFNEHGWNELSCRTISVWTLFKLGFGRHSQLGGMRGDD